MDLFLSISQGTGASLAAGVRAFIAALVLGALARGDVGVDFEGSDYSFLESVWWLAAMVVLVALTAYLQRRGTSLPPAAYAGPAVVMGALLFAGSLADDGYEAVPGLPAGAACALAALLAAQSFLGGAAARLRDAEAASFLELTGLATALVLALLAVLVPPISVVAFAFCVWLLAARRRRAQRKYEGLRILR